MQKDRIEVDVWAWGRGLESWLVDHLVIDGGPEQPASWDALGEPARPDLAACPWRTAAIARLAIDTGYEAPAVYAWARAQGFAQVAPVKGVEGFNRASPVSGPTYVDATDGGKRLRRGARLWTVAVSTFKAETYRFLRLERPTDEEIAAGATVPAGLHPPAGRGGSRMAEAVRRRAAGDGEDASAASPGSNGRSCASATRRSTPGSTPAPPPGSPARIGGPERSGATSRTSSGLRPAKPMAIAPGMNRLP